MFLLITLVLVGCLVALIVHFRKEFSEEGDDYTSQWLWRWLRRGAATPLFIWLLLNCGKMPFMPPLTGGIARMRAGGHFLEATMVQTNIGAIVIVSCWAALSFGWLMTGLIKRAKNKEDLVVAMVVWSPVLLPLWWFFSTLLGWSGMGLVFVLWLWPLMQYSLNVVFVPKSSPSYSHAIGKMKFGKYGEAEIAIISELERCESDFDGWMMLADLYAHQFNDLAEAEKTIYDLCDEPETTLSQISVALHRLADWHLKLNGDPLKARRVLEEICGRMPGTHLALMARQRINQIPTTSAEFAEQQTPRKVAMPALNESFAEAAEEKISPIDRETAMASVNQLVEKLRQDPNDVSTREKLAKVFAGQLGKYDLAIEQLELLIAMPEQSPEKAAEWLAWMAAWEIKQRGEGDGARKILERLIRDFPQSAQAFAAQRRLSLMSMNEKMQQRKKPASTPKPSMDDTA
jgi:tetratricopeptide (TPR) repeat protein